MFSDTTSSTHNLSTAPLGAGFIVGRAAARPTTPVAAPEPPHADHEAVAFMRQVRTLVKDLLEPNPWVYWTDFIATLVVGHGAFVLFTLDTAAWYMRAAGFVVAVFAFYRLTTFTHELSHFRKGTFKGFRAAWNALVGVPFLLPAFLYEDHRLHHVNHSYGTGDDSEYLPFASGSKRDIANYALKAFLVPLLGIFRFVIMAPLVWVSPSWRRWAWERSSSALAINWSYRRSPEDECAHPVEMRVMEVSCFLYGLAFFGLMVLGILPWTLFLSFYAVFVCVALVNAFRTVGAHRYQGSGEPMTYLDQILDSYTIAGVEPVSSLLAPLGMRFHALHHLVPSMPYHNMRTAHYRLVAGLPADSPYHRTIRKTLWQAVAEVVRSARGGAAEAKPILVGDTSS
jgi:fatty acid desaturase